MACTALAACITSSASPLIRSSPSRLVTVTLNSFSSRRMFSSKEPKILFGLLHPLNADPLFHAITPKVIRTRRPVHLLYK